MRYPTYLHFSLCCRVIGLLLCQYRPSQTGEDSTREGNKSPSRHSSIVFLQYIAQYPTQFFENIVAVFCFEITGDFGNLL